MKLTALQLPALPPGDYPDSAYPGLSFRVGARKRVWSLRYRIGDKQKRETLGAFPKMGLKDARWAAEAFLDRLAAGAPPPPRESESRETLGELITAYERMRKREGRRIKTLEKAMGVVRRALADYLRLPASSFGKRDLRAVRDAIAERHTHMGNRLLSCLSPILQWAVEEDRAGIEHNFCKDLRRAPETARDRALSHDEIRAVTRALQTFADGRRAAGRTFPRLLRFLLLTGCRLGEAQALRYGDILDGTWLQKDNKSSRPHRVYLSRQALAEIGSGPARALVFPGLHGGPISQITKPLRDLQRQSGTAGWRLHDLRRTFAAGCQDIEIEPSVIEGMLNHSLGGVMKHYFVSKQERQRAEAWQRWADRLDEIAGAAGRMAAR